MVNINNTKELKIKKVNKIIKFKKLKFTKKKEIK
jgi:hypothetical protein